MTKPAGANLSLIDPLTGETVGEEAKGALTKIRVNNNLRRTIRSALGGLTLLSEDRNTRLQAADACLDELVAAIGAKHDGYLARLGYRQQYSLPGGDADLAEALKLAPGDASVLSAAGLTELAAAQRVEGMTPLPDIPLAVITAAEHSCPPALAGLCTPAGLDLKRQLHAEWAARSTAGVHYVSARTGHYVMNDQPALMLDAVRFVLAQIRTAPAPVR